MANKKILLGGKSQFGRKQVKKIEILERMLGITLFFFMIQIIFVGGVSALPSLDDNPLHQLPATSGKISYFSSADTGQPAAWGKFLGEDWPGDPSTWYWYCAMRWPYVNAPTDEEKTNAKAWWYNKKILVTNPVNGRKIVLAAKDWGPAESKGRVIDVSSLALDIIGASTDSVVNIEFADQVEPLGPKGPVPKFLNPPFDDPDVTIKQGWRYNVKIFDRYTHQGIDYAKVDGNGNWIAFDVKAVAKGQAKYVPYDSVKGTGSKTYGNYVLTKHEVKGTTYYTLNAHMASSDLTPGVWTDVEREAKLGVAGKTGESNDIIHLHFEFSRDGYGERKYRIDPYGLYSIKNSYSGSAIYGPNSYWFSPLDLIFVIDTTGSMSDDIDAVKASSKDIINSLDSKVADYRIAVVDYRDFPVLPYGWFGDYPAKTDLPFTTDKNAAIQSIDALSIGDGMDWRESVYSGLIHAILDPSLSIGDWRKGVSKQILLLGDAPPHDPEPFTGFDAQYVDTSAFLVDPVIIQAIAIGGDSSTEAAFSTIATGTGGKLFTAPTSAELVEAIMAALGEAIEPTPPSDTTPPDIQIIPGIASHYTQGTDLSYLATDDGSGINTGSSTLDGVPVSSPVTLNAIGTHNYVVTATDNAGNVATKDLNFYVYEFQWRPPLTATGANKMELLSTMPVKFSVLDETGKLVIDPSVRLSLYDDTGSQKLGPFIYGMNNPNLYVDAQNKQYINTLHTNKMGLVPGNYEIQITFNSANLIGKNTIYIEILRNSKKSK